MAQNTDDLSMALFCDFENVALGVRDANYEKFDIKRVLERLLLKGSIVVKKAYCDWDRYKAFKATMHEANFELIEIPHVRQSGKNSADIRLVVDALDLCYTKAHVNTFVIISGDSDFSPLVSKLRENAKTVIGVGVKQSTSDLLIANCDEFIFYDDLVRPRESNRGNNQKTQGQNQPQQKPRTAEDETKRREEMDTRRAKAIDLAMSTLDALLEERGDAGRIWSSMLKQAIKRRQPGFNETYYGFKAFGNLMEELQTRGLIELGRDDKGGPYVQRRLAGKVTHEEVASPPPIEVAPAPAQEMQTPAVVELKTDQAASTLPNTEPQPETKPETTGRPRRARNQRSRGKTTTANASEVVAPQAAEPAPEKTAKKAPAKPRTPRRTKKPSEGPAQA
jgi:uncharacterized LabA/DUF88 family protein